MKAKQHLQALGYINKEVHLSNFQHTQKHDELILEALDLFSGYYNSHASENKSRHIYLMIKSFDEIHNIRVIRATQNIKKKLSFDFDASPGQLLLYNNPAQFIRISIVNFDHVSELIEAYKNAGIGFVKNQNVKAFQSLIKILKYFDLESTEEGIFRSSAEPEISYLMMPDEIPYAEFQKINTKVQHNFIEDVFDAAQGFYYTKQGVHDFIRVYTKKDFLADKLKQIQKMFLDEAKLIGK